MNFEEAERLRALAAKGYAVKYSEHFYFSSMNPQQPSMEAILETCGAEGAIEHEPSRTRHAEKGYPDAVIYGLEDWVRERGEAQP